MQTVPITIDRSKARELYRAYKKHRHYSEPMDDEIRRAYQLLAQGRLIIRALESVRAAGLGPDGLPKLAICRADKKVCRFDFGDGGRATMYAEGYNVPWRENNKVPNNVCFYFERGSFTRTSSHYGGRSILPPIPLHVRPQRGLANYHVLWEAEWTRVPPKDPYLLRRLGKSDMWLVVAMWDLTEVERAALATRMNNA